MDITTASSPMDITLPADPVTTTVAMSCSKGGATTTRQILKFLVPAASTF